MTRLTQLCSVLLLVQGCTLFTVAHANTPLDGEDKSNRTSERDIERISVTASPFKTRVNDSASAIEVLAGDEKARYQSLSLGASLDKMAGVSNVATGGQSGKPVLRGLSGDRIRILLDGVPQDHQQYGVRHPPNLDPVLADRVEVVKGPMSVLYGADAMGGVVNVISRPLLLDSSSTGIKRATLFSQYHSNNNQRSLYLDGDASYNNWGGYLGLGQTEADNFATPKVLTYPANTSGTAPLFSGEIPFTDFKARDLASAIGFANDTFESTLRYTFWSNDQNYLQQNGQPTGQFLKNHNVLFDSAYQFNDMLLIKSRLSWQQNLRDAGTGIAYQALNDDTVDLSLELNRYQGRFSVLHEAIGGWQGELGIDVVNKQQYTHVGNLIPDADSKSYSVFAFERQSAGRWVTEIGLRFDHMKQQADLSTRESDSRQWNALSGSLGLTWQFADSWLAITHLARGFRAPSVFDLYAKGVHGGVAAYQQGNPLLKEEYSFNKDVGIRYFTQRVNVSFIVFHNAIDDYIYQARTAELHAPSGLPIHRLEQCDARLWGSEIDAQWQFTDSLKLQANYTQINSKLSNSGTELPLLPADKVHAELLWQPETLLIFQAAELYLNTQYYAKKQSAGVYEPFSQYDRLPFGTASTESYALWNVGLKGELKLRSSPLILRLSVTNVFDKAHSNFLDTYKGYALGQGRSINLSLTLPIKG